MSSRASDRVNVGMFWNSPSFSSLPASSSPVIFSRVREVGKCTGAGMVGGIGGTLKELVVLVLGECGTGQVRWFRGRDWKVSDMHCSRGE